MIQTNSEPIVIVMRNGSRYVDVTGIPTVTPVTPAARGIGMAYEGECKQPAI